MRIREQARNLRAGDVVGSGEIVIAVERGARTPSGKVEVFLRKNEITRKAVWGAYTTIGAERPEV